MFPMQTKIIFTHSLSKNKFLIYDLEGILTQAIELVTQNIIKFKKETKMIYETLKHTVEIVTYYQLRFCRTYPA